MTGWRKWCVAGPPALLLLGGCGPADPEAARIDQIEDTAEAAADRIEDEADTRTDSMEAEAKALGEQATGNVTTFDAERLQARAQALRREANIIERQADAQARAIRDKARAEVSAIRAQ